MKIALLTIWHVKNYGAEMQAYATLKALKKLGYDVQLIDYRIFKTSWNLKSLGIRFFTYITKEDAKFRRFWKKYISSTKYYPTYKSLEDNPPKADIYLVGSDQVWNPSITKNSAKAFFLPFGGSKIKRCSYASSFGTSNWQGNEELSEIANQYLSKFSRLSCRETAGVKILKDTFRLDSQNVLDPTLLHEEYPELTGIIERKKELAYYPLNEFSALENFAKQLSEELGLDFKNINEKKYLIRHIIWNRLGVEEWVKSIAESSFVVTPSFHGVCFSLIYHRQFIVVQNPNGGKVSSRILSLLKRLGLENRFFISIEDVVKSKVWKEMIDYTIIDKKLSVLREESWKFLKSI